MKSVCFSSKSLLSFYILHCECVHTWHSYSKEYVFIYETLAQNAQKECAGQEIYEKIYLTTTQYNGGARSLGEENFENFFSNLGFKIIAPEKFSIARQIHLIFNAKEIVSTLGSIAHLSLFAKVGTKQYILTRDYVGTLPAQIIISQAKKLDYIIINASANFLHSSRAWGPINLAFTSEFCEFARDIFGVEIKRNFGDIERYIVAWCEYFSAKFLRMATLDAFDFLNRLSREFCDKTLYRKNFEKILIPLKNPNSNQKCVGEFLSETLSTKVAKPAPNAPKIELHFSGVGWINTNEALFKDKDLEAIKITNAKYDCFFLVDGILSSGELCGTTGQNKALQAFSIKLYGDFAIIYKIHCGKMWSRWFVNGERTSKCEKIRGVKIAVLQREILEMLEKALGDFKGAGNFKSVKMMDVNFIKKIKAKNLAKNLREFFKKIQIP